MDRITGAFWALIVVLFGASAYYGTSAESERRGLQRAQGDLAAGEIVQFAQVIDGDTVVVTKSGGGRVTVRLLGIRTFPTRVEREPETVFGRAAEDRLRELARNPALRVLPAAPARDRKGRALATLYAHDVDLGLELIRDGLALAYPVHPFPLLSVYVAAQDAARRERRGLWSSPEVTAAAERLNNASRGAIDD